MCLSAKVPYSVTSNTDQRLQHCMLILSPVWMPLRYHSCCRLSLFPFLSNIACMSGQSAHSRFTTGLDIPILQVSSSRHKGTAITLVPSGRFWVANTHQQGIYQLVSLLRPAPHNHMVRLQYLHHIQLLLANLMLLQQWKGPLTALLTARGALQLSVKLA